MGRQARQMLQAQPGKTPPPNVNVVTVSSRLQFECVPLSTAEHWDMFRVMLSIGPEADGSNDWGALPARLEAGDTQAHAFQAEDIPQRLMSWLAHRRQEYSVAVVCLNSASSEALLADVVGALRSAPGEVHVVSERDLTAREQRLQFDSIVRVRPSRTMADAAILFTALSSDTAEYILSCCDLEDCRVAYGTTAAPSLVVEVWWDPESIDLVFTRPEDRAFVARSPAVIAVVYLHGRVGFREPVSALRDLVGADAFLAIRAPIDFLAPLPVQNKSARLVRIHLLCAKRPPA